MKYLEHFSSFPGKMIGSPTMKTLKEGEETYLVT